MELRGATATFTFRDNSFELPPMITLGGNQILALHQFPGGRRVLQQFGEAPVDAVWSGIFLGADAFDRAVALQAMEAKGGETTLVYGQFVFKGWLASALLTPHWDGFVKYQCTFRITQIPAQQTAAAQSQPSQTQNTQVALGNAQQAALIAVTASAVATAQISALSTALAALDPTASSDTVAAQAVALAAQNAALLVLIDSLDTLDAQVALAVYVQVQVLLLALQGAPIGPGLVTLTVTDANLFKIAARIYGDPEQALTISAYNGNIPFFNPGVTLTLVLPPLT